MKTLTVNISAITIALFNKAISKTSGYEKSFKEINQLATKLGYIIHPDACTNDVYDWLVEQNIDINSTFYKNWEDVTSKSRLDLWIEQCRHYASTYGTNFSGDVYVPEGDVALPSLKNFKVIHPITIETASERCVDMLYSGIALSENTINDIMNILELLDNRINVDLVKNKEAKMILCQKYSLVPSEPVEFLRYLLFLATTKTLLIKDSNTIALIKASNFDITKIVKLYDNNNVLSSIFNRFKPLFLAFKSANKANAPLINKLRKLADVNHKPMVLGYFENILINPSDISELPSRLANITNFKKINLLQTINIRLKELNTRAFLVRNQKVFIKKETVSVDSNYLKLVYDIIYADLVKSMTAKASTVRIPSDINYTLPTSEKSFIGNYPIGTSFDLSETDNVVGIHWRSEEGANDLDFSLTAVDGTKYGWNAAYKNDNNSIVYSGDMTYANPEATELFYTTKSFNPCILRVNGYSSTKGAKFRFFLAKEKINNIGRNYMVNPDNIRFKIESTMDSKEKSLGVITENKLVLAQFRTGNGRVAYSNVTTEYIDYALSTLDCYINLKQLLLDAGFTFVDKDAKLDLTDISKDTLISLFA